MLLLTLELIPHGSHVAAAVLDGFITDEVVIENVQSPRRG
jgi:hypothetical protein